MWLLEAKRQPSGCRFYLLEMERLSALHGVVDLAHGQLAAIAGEKADQRPLRVDYAALLEVHCRNE